MEITLVMWNAITGLKFFGALVGKGNTSVVEDFNKMQYYVSYLKNLLMKVKGFHVGAFKLGERVIAFIITWMLTSKGSNHVVLTEKDFVLVYYIMKNIKVNWIHVFKELMQKSVRLSDDRLPHVILVSKFLQYFEVDMDKELTEVVNRSHEINNSSLNKMGFIKLDNMWVSKEEVFVGPFARSSKNTSFDDEIGPSAGAAEGYSMRALVSFDPHADYGIPMS